MKLKADEDISIGFDSSYYSSINAFDSSADRAAKEMNHDKAEAKAAAAKNTEEEAPAAKR